MYEEQRDFSKELGTKFLPQKIFESRQLQPLPIFRVSCPKSHSSVALK